VAGAEHDHPSGWLSLPILKKVGVAKHVVRNAEDTFDDTLIYLLELRVSILRASDGKTTQVFHGTHTNAYAEGDGGIPWPSIWWSDVKLRIPNMEGPDALTLRTSGGMVLGEDSFDYSYDGRDDRGLPAEISLSTICLGFDINSEDFVGFNQMAHPSVSEISAFIRMAGLIWR
jgi:hypothetical protein